MKNLDLNARHTREKLTVYGRYLHNYLAVMTNQPNYQKIVVVDLFAGEGIGEKDSPGSAVIARNAIAHVMKVAREKERPGAGHDIRLILNDKNPDNCARLKEYAKGSFVEVCNDDADKLLSRLLADDADAVRRLFFIDPFGYTQISTQNLRRVFSVQNSEVLIFVPTNHIYRFRAGPDKVVAKFLTACGVAREGMEARDIHEFNSAIKKAFQEMADSGFVYSRAIQNQSASNSSYCLFFITHHIAGARKFLEAVDKIGKETKTLFDLDYAGREKMIADRLAEWRDNTDLCNWGIIQGILPKDIRPILMQWEKANRIEINSKPDRKKGAFYLDDKTPKISMRMKRDVWN